ncbi:phage tail protein [Pectobacterium brasiliense]|uniref:phage tail-collar fiber domain-containing protein n=1 Tax=Pectobacterium brasiliense TaxID=180957 RepID=UPI000B95CFB2|nr:phage tail protein [Pectobacterium carotovorum]OYN52260.1 hypothetical protein B7L51_05645 [Pectobacterium carotovorum]
MSKYFALLTNIGAAKLANATALGNRLNITRMAVGDGGGVLPTPNPAQTKLINEKRRAALNTLSVDPKNPSQIIAEQVIPENEGGFWIREIGLFDDDGNLIAIANCPETYKPQLQEGSGRIQTVRMILIVSSTDAVTLKIDPAVVLATRGYVDDAVIEVKAYADSLMKTHLAAADPHPQYAPKASPALTGKPTAPTAAQASNDTQLATTAFVKSAVAALINGSPGALDTLQELAKALGNDPNFSATILAELAKKLPLSGGTLTGNLMSTAADVLRMGYGGYSAILRQDGGGFYILLTNKGDANGAFNSLRPLRIDMATGNIEFGHNANASVLLEKGQRVYSPNNKPTAADVGALTDVLAAQKYAQLESPALIGKPTAPTAVQASNDTQIATTAFVKSAVAALVSGSPAALDTLQELAKALGNDPNFSTTVLNAVAGKLAKDQNGADIPNKDLFVKNIGTVRAFSPGMNIGGGDGAWKTSDFIASLKTLGAFNHPYWICKGSWYYAGNKTITDTECGDIHLAGAVIEVAGAENAFTVRITTASSTVGKNAQFIYVNNGDNYSPGWRRDYNTRNPPTAADVQALPSVGGTLTGRLKISGSLGGEALLLDTNSDTEPLYIRGQKNGVHSWYVGKGGRDSDDVMLSSYTHNTILRLKSDRIEVNKPLYIGENSVLTDKEAAQKYALRSIRVNGKPLSADVNLLAGDINTWNKTEADARYLMKGVTVPGTITATGSGSGYYWRKYADGMIELFGTFETVINASRDVAFPVKLGEVVNITWNEVGGYNGANAFVGRVSGVSGSGFTHHWDVWDSNRYGSGNNQTIHYHVLAKAA